MGDLLNKKKRCKSFGWSATGYVMLPLTCSLHFAEVQAHLFDGKIHLEGSNLLPENQKVFNLEKLPINWTLEYKYETVEFLAEMCSVKQTAGHTFLT
jgi:hypothetical protein